MLGVERGGVPRLRRQRLRPVDAAVAGGRRSRRRTSRRPPSGWPPMLRAERADVAHRLRPLRRLRPPGPRAGPPRRAAGRRAGRHPCRARGHRQPRAAPRRRRAGRRPRLRARATASSPRRFDTWYLPEAEITTVVDVTGQLDRKRAAMAGPRQPGHERRGRRTRCGAWPCSPRCPTSTSALAFAKEWFVRRGDRRRPASRTTTCSPVWHDGVVAHDLTPPSPAASRSRRAGRLIAESARGASCPEGQAKVAAAVGGRDRAVGRGRGGDLRRRAAAHHRQQLRGGVGRRSGSLGPWQVLLLAVVWLVNMATYTGVLTNSLPGLTHPQAFVANLSSSAVSNVLPFGGAAGVGATYLMYGSWGFTASETTRSILVSGVWNVLAKLALPVVALVHAVVHPRGHPRGGQRGGDRRGGAGGQSILLFWLVLRSDAFADAVGRFADRVPQSCLTRLIRRPPVTGIEERLVAFRHESRSADRRALGAAHRLDRALQREPVRAAAALPARAARARPTRSGGRRCSPPTPSAVCSRTSR